MFLLGNENKPDEHLKVLKNIATLLNNPDFIDQIVSCSSPEEVTETIIEFEETEKFGKEV
jgi:mannitol/fructose-specific phosphotransferase system IIA component (Ntr-type)